MRKAIGVLFLAAVFAGCLGVSKGATSATQSLNKIDVIVLGARPGAQAIPMGVYSDDQVAHLMRRPGLSILSMPSATVANGMPTQIEIQREAKIPGLAHPKKVDMTMSFKLNSSRQVSFRFTSVHFQGFSAPRHGDPILNTQRLASSYVVPGGDNSWQVFILPEPVKSIAYDKLGKLQRPDDYPQLLLIRVAPVKACSSRV